MTQVVSEQAQTALNAMEDHARLLGVHGVALFCRANVGELTLSPHIRIVDIIERAPDHARGEGDTGTNYLGVVCTKWAEMLSTGIHSGHASRPPKTGELGFQGGLIKIDESGSYCFAFSGASPQEDFAIAVEGALSIGLDVDMM